MQRNKLPFDQTIPFLGHKLNYQVLGKGKSVIFLHGGVTNSSPYFSFVTLLSKQYQVYVLDLPGYGGSDTIGAEVHNTDLAAKALNVFIKKLSLGKAPIIAFSTNTITAAKAKIRSKLKNKLIFVGVPGKLTGWEFELMQRMPLGVKRWLFGTNFGMKNFLLPILKTNTGTDGEKVSDEDLISHIRHTDARGIVDLDPKVEFEQEMPALLKKLKGVTFIYGEHDANQEFNRQHIKNFIIIKGSDHNIFSIKPKETLQILRKHL